MYFRPLLTPTIATSIMLPVLLGLGVWQVERLKWKEDLIAEMQAHLAAPPISLRQAIALRGAAQYRHVALEGRFDNAAEAYVYTTGEGGAPVFHVITPLMMSDGQSMLVDRGYVPGELRDPAKRPAGLLAGTRSVVGVWRTPDSPGLFTPGPDEVRRTWYARDVASIAASNHLRLSAPVIVEADATPNAGGWPKGGQTVIDLPNNHLGYAITWFGLAAGLLGVYFAYHWAQGALGRSKLSRPV